MKAIRYPWHEHFKDLVDDNKIGIVTTFDGAPLPAGEIAGSIILGHDNFQNGQKFIDGGGYKGLQEEFISEGAYSLNPWFVKVKQVPLLRIPAKGILLSETW